MQHKLLKQLTLALLMTVAVPYAKSQVAHVGDILCTTGVYVSPAEYEASGLEAMGVIFYVDATGQHGWAVALEDAGNFGWGPNVDTPLPNYSSSRAAIYDLDGLFNTQEILSYGTGFSAFAAMDVANGWYLPALGQLNYLYGNLVEVNASLTIVGGMVFDMSSAWEYWSSTERTSHSAWRLQSSGALYGNNFASNGGYGAKPEGWRVRGVRNF